MIYPSDYGYACDLSNTTDNIGTLNYCSDYNWMSKGSSYTITPNSGKSTEVFQKWYDKKRYEAQINYGDSSASLGIYPVITLDPELIISSGNGSKDNPYVIEGSTFVPGEPESSYNYWMRTIIQ